MWVAVYPSTHLIMEIRQGRRAPNDFWQPASAPGKTETGSRRAPEAKEKKAPTYRGFLTFCAGLFFSFLGSIVS